MSVNACAISHQKIDIKKSIVCKWHIKGHSDYKIRHLKAKVEIKKNVRCLFYSSFSYSCLYF